MTEKFVKRYQLCIERIETLEDVKKILNAMQIRLDAEDPLFEELSHYFSVEVVPPGYLKVYEKVGDKIYEMSVEEIIQMGSKLLQNEKTN